ncbi:hypothetical protein [Streptomyces sp. NPDC020747]|uniref:hypothetical protein n=1 Tax=Streptomyces sp. NPDC020747 TaxID=3365086 RepID=UPI00379AEEAF
MTEYKHFSSIDNDFAGLEIKSASKGEIEAVFVTLNCVDRDGDVTERNAFESGALVRISDWNRSSWGSAPPVGRGRIFEVANEVILRGQFFVQTQHGRDAFETVKGLGELAEFSYGFDVVDSLPAPRNSPYGVGHKRTLRTLRVHEVSPVLKAAGIGTRVLATKSAGTGLAPYQMAIVEQAHESLLRDQFEEAKVRFDAEMRCAELVALKDGWVREHGAGYSEVRPSVIDLDVGAAALSAVHRYGPRLGLDPDLIEIRWFADEIDDGTRTKFGDPVGGPDFADFFAEYGTAIKGLTRPKLEPWTIRLHAGLSLDEVIPVAGHELGHLADMDEAGVTAFEETIRTEITS